MGRIHDNAKRINSDVKSLRLPDTTDKRVDVEDLQRLPDTHVIHIKKSGVARKARDHGKSPDRSLNAAKLFENNPPPEANKRTAYSTYSTRSKKALHRPMPKRPLGNAATPDLSTAYPPTQSTHELQNELNQLSGYMNFFQLRAVKAVMEAATRPKFSEEGKFEPIDPRVHAFAQKHDPEPTKLVGESDSAFKQRKMKLKQPFQETLPAYLETVKSGSPLGTLAHAVEQVVNSQYELQFQLATGDATEAQIHTTEQLQRDVQAALKKSDGSMDHVTLETLGSAWVQHVTRFELLARDFNHTVKCIEDGARGKLNEDGQKKYELGNAPGGFHYQLGMNAQEIKKHYETCLKIWSVTKQVFEDYCNSEKLSPQARSVLRRYGEHLGQLIGTASADGSPFKDFVYRTLQESQAIIAAHKTSAQSLAEDKPPLLTSAKTLVQDVGVPTTPLRAPFKPLPPLPVTRAVLSLSRA
ncbi:MAG: hypothetical protein GTN84_18125 [Hydrogenophaga sp.]|uniref:hypothetical protein n=1 Tax=Hydrogenophaga sp. TaxID=1904254 RepID=UPI0016A433A1|nr:hypothetical protein [Hydrogenophaga sp.]NIM43161.1 hypothetical protein [Hydrogenophaga sp.]NIN28229.1 hypothetical protein [Hydrogenophaga sp.]NIN30667.1 hypothetical protein [Hydrogenophaga sp.]NIN57364.1 hypothetical protein [Hydrogenophaga sp.]NIO51583.1 hypothetical protein [Hydrogenophaga sp.]